ncbi:low molecular weight protein-tyrosine-phosphatase [Selenomonas sp. TAMA-11512]|uniref:low molecular weight protein-tyrosine-phosphatase n=1 Tax=Selenomonas sp. TAMA-11512 TaxID=3095337 RepID=UPI00308B73FE|nr:low molecular weight protein-tyrosine-phosphatase [Selenomonas sp. TAMA-11512]
MYKICFVCHGNICRSTMAEFVMKDLLEKTGLSEEVAVISRGCSAEEVGSDTYPDTKAILRKYNIPFSSRHARKLSADDYAASDLILGMDASNMRLLDRLTEGDPANKNRLFLSLVGEHRDVRDPWYSGNFEETYRDVKKGCEALLEKYKKGGKI